MTARLSDSDLNEVLQTVPLFEWKITLQQDTISPSFSHIHEYKHLLWISFDD